MATRRALTPLISISVAYLGFFVGGLVLVVLLGPEYEHSNNLSRGVVFLAWTLLALTAIVVSLTSLMFVAKDLRRWLRIATVVLNLPVLAVASLVFVVGIWSLQDYSASFSAYDTAVQVCGHPPVIPTHDRFIFGGTVYYCTAAEAEAHGLRPLP